MIGWRRIAPGVAVLISIHAVAIEDVIAQAYTYDPPTCGVPYHEDPAKPQELRVVAEINAANQCVKQSKFPLACRHFQGALEAADRMSSEAGSPDGIKVYLKTMLKSYGCQ